MLNGHGRSSPRSAADVGPLLPAELVGAGQSGRRHAEPGTRRNQLMTLFLLVAMMLGWAVAQAAPVPTMTVANPPSDLLGSTVTLTASFSNTSGTVTDVGYGPYLDVLLPPSPDPISFDGATYLGQQVVPRTLALGPTGVVEHPFA